MINIHYDFIDGTEVSYGEGKMLDGDFNTNCLLFFTNDSREDVVIECEDGRYMSKNEIMSNDNFYTEKHIRHAHNILKMFLAGGFNWKQRGIHDV